jgi:ribosomal protein S18 acetylase RimI-like enzyme
MIPGMTRKARSLWSRLQRGLYRRAEEVLICRELTVHTPPAVRLSFRPIEPGLSGGLIEIARRNDDPAFDLRLACYLAAGYRGLAAMDGDRMVGYVWWVHAGAAPAASHPHVRRFGISLGPADIYMFDLMIDAACRGRGYAAEMLSRFHQQVYEAGVRRVWATVRAANTPARRLYRAAGYVDVATFTSRCFFNRFLRMDGRWFRPSTARELCSFDWRELRPRTGNQAG